jgi:putative PEP-CTERM system histidine kinase
MTLQILSLISLALGLLAYLGLTVFCIITWARGITGRAAFAAAVASLLFILSLVLIGIGPVSLSLENLSLLCWMVLLMRVIGVGFANARDPRLRPVVGVFLTAFVVALFSVTYPWVLAVGHAAGYEPRLSWLFGSQLLLAICGLVLLEQVVRNTRDDYRWRLRYLNIGIGTLFSFELVHSALALMLGAYVPALVAVQPAMFALAVPFIAIASARNPANPLRLNLSRQFVFRGGMLMATGVALLLLGFLGYLVQALEGDWGAALLAMIAALTVVGAATVFGSSAVRLRARRLLEEHLFAHKYDYREEWRRVTEQLTEPSPDYDLPQQVLRALGRVLQSPGGAVWRLSGQGLLIPLSTLHTRWNQPLSPRTSEQLKAFFEHRDWVLDLEDLPPSAGPVIADAEDLAALPGIRYVVPLMAENRLFGVAALTAPPGPQSLDWEDYDVIKLIARQASGFIALREAERELADADKLRSFNQVSAFIVHDVKTISSQLSLLTENAGKHKSNPAFIDDMIATVGNAVERMQRLLAQLRDGTGQGGEAVDLGTALEETVRSFQCQSPAPELRLPDKAVTIAADPSKLRSAVGHIIQNAIDAANLQSEGSRCPPRVAIALVEQAPWAEVTVEDSGPGMEQPFIEKALFQPFTSTKGVTGMGVGAYQARSYVRSLGGDVSVDSSPGQGSRFIIRLPLKTQDP